MVLSRNDDLIPNSKSYSECKNDIINKLESLDYSVYTHQDGDITNDKESSEIINGQEFKTGGLYAIKKEERALQINIMLKKFIIIIII